MTLLVISEGLTTTIRQVSMTLLVISEGLTKLFIRIIRQHSKNGFFYMLFCDIFLISAQNIAQ